jgi:hypothetical protein
MVSASLPQALMGNVIFGNRDASPVYARLDSDIEIGVWISIDEDIGFIHIPLASDDSIIVSRNGGEFFYPLTDWDDVGFLPPNPDPYLPGYTNQSILGFYDLGGGPIPHINTNGDTILIANYFMHTTDDSTHLYKLSGIIFPTAATAFSPLLLVDYYPGDANGSGVVNGLDVVFLVNYFRDNGPIPYPLLSADANGDCMVNGLDVIYLVNYFKGGPAPFYGYCY